MASDPLPRISQQIWEAKYRLKAPDGQPVDATIEDSWRRTARAVAAAEPKRKRAYWEKTFSDAMADFTFLPAGRILAGAGTDRGVTLFNCFVMDRIEDDLASIFDNVKQAALTMQQGGGIGHDFSTLRPKGALVKSIGADASGPVSFMDVWDTMCRSIMSAGARRGAMMATLRCDHPDIETFIDAKSDPQRLRNFNLSVLVTDPFLKAVRNGEPWDLVFGGKVYRTVDARELWDRMMRATYDYAEPGVIFIDRVNAQNNLGYCEDIFATNPCGEQPLPPYGACLLGSINLARLVAQPFARGAVLDEARLETLVATAVRFLDDTIDISGYPLPAQRKEALNKRRIGLGVTGLADALIFCGVRYGTDEAARLAGRWMEAIETAAYRASAAIAAEKGAFPLFDAERYLAAPNVSRLPRDIQDAIRKTGIRNGLLTSIAPTGTISLLAHNVSSGVEPVFDFVHRRRVTNADGSFREETVENYSHAVYRAMFGPDAPLTPAFVTAAELSPTQHLDMQASLQRHVDSSISKTINCPVDISFEDFKDVYLRAYDRGLKGCTTYRPNAVTGSVLQSGAAQVPAGPAPDAMRPAASLALPAERDDSVVYMSDPLERDSVLSGATYKLKWQGSDHALYITINDIEHDGRRRPFEIFINSKNLEHYAWTVALTRMISAVFRRGGDVSFVVDELKAIFDPQGGQWSGGRYVPSLIAAIGEVIEGHMRSTGFLRAQEPAAVIAAEAAQRDGGTRPAGGGTVTRGGQTCPRCGTYPLLQREGCWVCSNCDYSKCA